MKGSKKDSSNRLGMFFSIALHVGLILLILYWGFSGSSQYSSNPGPIEVSISGLETGGGSSKPPPPVKKSKPKPPEPEPEEVVEEEPPPPEPEPEPEKKEVVKEEPKKEEPKKDVIPLEEEKKEVAKKPEPTAKPKPTDKPKPKATPKPTEKPKPTAKPKPKPTKKPAPKKDFDKEKERILKDIQRQKVLDELKNNEPDTQEPANEFEDEEIPMEEMGEERRLAMGDDINNGGEPDSGGSSSRTSGGGSAISPLIIQTYANQVHRKISRNWRIPPGVPTDGGLFTSLVFKVDSSGNVNNVRITESSGNSVFDNYCKQAIIRSAPLPPPPAELAEEAKTSGIELTFRPDQ